MIHTTEIIQSMIEFIQFDLYYTNPRALTKKIVKYPSEQSEVGILLSFKCGAIPASKLRFLNEQGHQT